MHVKSTYIDELNDTVLVVLMVAMAMVAMVMVALDVVVVVMPLVVGLKFVVEGSDFGNGFDG